MKIAKGRDMTVFQHQKASVVPHVIRTATITIPLSNPSHTNAFLPTTPPHTSSPQRVSPQTPPSLGSTVEFR